MRFPSQALAPGLAAALALAPCADHVLAQRWRPDDRVLLTSFHLVSGLARDERFLYAATPRGLQILDMVSRRWELPSTAEDGYPDHEDPSALAFDPGTRRLWLGTLAGSLYTYQVDLQQWTLETSPGLGPLLRLVWYEGPGGEGLYLRSPSGWHRLPPFSFVPEPVPAGRLPGPVRVLELPPEDRLARIEPAFAGARGTLLMDEDLQRWPMTDFVRGERQGLFWLATAGDDLYLFDSRFVTTEPHRFGLLSTSASALARDGRWIWFAGDGRGPRKGVTAGRDDLQEWRWYESRGRGAPSGTVHDVVAGDEGVWFAARDGLYRLDSRTGRWSRAGGGAGSMEIHRLALAEGGTLWGAGRRGLVRVGPAGEGTPSVAGGPGLRAVLAVGDTLWVAGDQGVQRFGGGGERLPWTGEAEASVPPGLVDLARFRGEVWGATPAGLWRFDGAVWQGPLREVSQGGVGEILRLRAGEDGFWVAGTGGAARLDPEADSWRYLLVGRDLETGPVRDVLQVGDRVLLATPGGVAWVAWKEAF